MGSPISFGGFKLDSSILPKITSFCNDDKLKNILVKVAAVTVTGVCLHLAVKTYIKIARNRRRNGYKKDVVVLHQFDRCTTLPTISPYALKVETYLRVAKIPYENDFREPFGPKGKCPWITYNGVDIADSSFCLQFLESKFPVDFNTRLEPAEKAISRCLAITAEYNFMYCAAMWRFDFDKDLAIFKILPSFPSIGKYLSFYVRRRVRKFGYYQGIGRHSEKEIYRIGIDDLKAFSAYLGNDKYFLGEEVSEVDCAMFGVLAQCVWALPNSPFEAIVNGELQNLKKFCIRMKEEFWPDWDEILYKK